MLLRTDKQIIINPLLIIIASILVMLPCSENNVYILDLSIQNIKITLYSIYLVIIRLGLYSTSKKDGII